MSPIHQLSQLAASEAATNPSRPPAADAAKVEDAAQQFDGLLLAQVLHSAHGDEGGWLGSGGDESGSCAGDYAEQQLAGVMAQKGGLGLAKLIAAGLEKSDPGSAADR